MAGARKDDGVITRMVVRVTAAARATCLTLIAVSCSVYDASLLESGSSPIGNGGSAAVSGQAGSAGKASAGGNNGGSAGKSSEDAGSSGMSEMAGEVESGGTAGTAGGGTAGAAAGTGGTGGGMVAGSGNTGGTVGGSGGTAGSGGTGGAAPAIGCAKLSVPLDDANDRAHFVITFPANVDMTTGTISMRVYVQAGVGGTLFNYVQDAAPNYHFFGVASAARPELPSLVGWSNLTWDVGAQPDMAPVSNIVKNSIKRIGIEINAAPATVWSNPTIVYIDSITVTTPTVTQSFTFDTAATLTPTPTTADPSTPILWLNSASSDTKAANVTLAWQPTCP